MVSKVPLGNLSVTIHSVFQGKQTNTHWGVEQESEIISMPVWEKKEDTFKEIRPQGNRISIQDQNDLHLYKELMYTVMKRQVSGTYCPSCLQHPQQLWPYTNTNPSLPSLMAKEIIRPPMNFQWVFIFHFTLILLPTVQNLFFRLKLLFSIYSIP